MEFIRPAAITLMFFSQPLTFIPVIFIFNASGTSELCFSYLQASLPRFLWGIHRGSVDAVSDTFRFLPFIFPPTQLPCTVAGECSWCDVFIYFFFPPSSFLSFSPKYKLEGSRGFEQKSLQHHLSPMTNRKPPKHFLFCCSCRYVL